MKANQKSFILITYILLGSSFEDYAAANLPVNLCIFFSCLAMVLIIVKNIFYVPKAIRKKVTVCDIGIVVLFTAMLFSIPSYMGLVKCLIIAVIGGSCAGLLSWKICSD